MLESARPRPPLGAGDAACQNLEWF